MAARTGGTGRVRSSPRARRLAAELGIGLSTVTGTGPDGAVTVADVQRAAARVPTPGPPEPGRVASAPEPPAPERVAAVPEAPETPARGRPTSEARERVASLRRAIGALMTRSKQTIPHYYLSTTLDLRTAVGWMQSVNAHRPVAGRLVPVGAPAKSRGAGGTGRPRGQRLLRRRRVPSQRGSAPGRRGGPAPGRSGGPGNPRRRHPAPGRAHGAAAGSCQPGTCGASAARRNGRSNLDRDQPRRPRRGQCLRRDLSAPGGHGGLRPGDGTALGPGRAPRGPACRHRYALGGPPGQRRAARRPLTSPGSTSCCRNRSTCDTQSRKPEEP